MIGQGSFKLTFTRPLQPTKIACYMTLNRFVSLAWPENADIELVLCDKGLEAKRKLRGNYGSFLCQGRLLSGPHGKGISLAPSFSSEVIKAISGLSGMGVMGMDEIAVSVLKMTAAIM